MGYFLCIVLGFVGGVLLAKPAKKYFNLNDKDDKPSGD